MVMAFCVRSWCVAAVLTAALVCASDSAAQGTDIESQLQEATRLADASEWDKAIALLNGTVEQLTRGPLTPESRRLLIDAYEQRAVADMQVGAPDRARGDFAALLL